MKSERYFCPLTGLLLRSVDPVVVQVIDDDTDDAECIPEGLNLTIERYAVDQEAYDLATSAETQAEMRATLKAKGVPDSEIDARVAEVVAQATAPSPVTLAMPQIGWSACGRIYELTVKEFPAFAELFKPPGMPSAVHGREAAQA